VKYSIFSYTIESELPLPELHAQKTAGTAEIFFLLSPVSSHPNCNINWCHHWRLPNGQISISAGREGNNYWLRFPKIADFHLTPDNSNIIAYRYTDIPDETIRHLLLDQVIPRLLSHQGNQILHASCIKTADSALVFCGESGWGKSTLAAFFHSQGYPILTDDCLLLKTNDSDEVFGIPNYQGIRLFQDSLSLFPEERKTTPVAHYGTKKRIITESNSSNQATQIKAIFILPDPVRQLNKEHVSVCQINGAAAAVELIKNSFPLDITDRNAIGGEFQRIARIARSKNLSVYQLNYPHRMEMLPAVLKLIHRTMALEQ
jgi:hypothetical protein